MENQILEAKSYIKNVDKNISKTSASNINFWSVNETMKEVTVENEINDNFKIIEKPIKGDERLYLRELIMRDFT